MQGINGVVVLNEPGRNLGGRSGILLLLRLTLLLLRLLLRNKHVSRVAVDSRAVVFQYLQT